MAKALHGVTDEMVEAGNGYKGWFQFGPHGDLVGQRTSQVGVDQASAGSAKVEKLAEYGKVDPDSGLVPAQVSGQVDLAAGVPGPAGGGGGPQRGDRRGVGDVPGGAGRPGQPAEGPPDKFSAMALDTLFKKGDNRLELFVIDDSGGRVRLRPLTVS